VVFKRKIYHRMLEWKNERKGKTALLIEGARRVGKSFLCQQFGENEYKSMIFIDFSFVDEQVIDFFLYERTNLDLFFAKLSAHYNTPLFKRESLFVFDEVQRFPIARQLIKHLVADGRYDYIETGSLISLKQNVEDIVIPSEEESIKMYPLDFEEFLWAAGTETTSSFLRDSFEQLRPLGRALHSKIMNDFRQYMIVGGMPQAVVEYTANKDFAAVDLIKKNILKLYRDDISKFAGRYKSKVNLIFDNIPAQLSKKEKKYSLASISKNARKRRYEDAFMWLDDAMVINPCFNAANPSVGLALSSDYATQKLYMADTGLLVTHAFRDGNYIDNELYRAILLDKLHINEGMIMENAVAQALRASGHRLFFYSRADSAKRQNNIEIDFLITRKNKVSPVEVKSASYRYHSSLDKFNAKFSKTVGEPYVVYTKDVMIRDGITHIPVYMTMFL